MIMQVLHCPHCQGTDIIRHGKARQGKQRYCCQEKVCDGRTFLLDYSYAGHSAAIKQQIVDQVISKRMVKKQQMRWSQRGAHLLLQIRTRVLHGDWETTFRTWYPGFRSHAQPVAA